MRIRKVTTYPPSERTLRKKIIEYLKDCQPNYYRYLKKSGELEDYTKDTITRTKRYAANFKETGMVESEAWNMAVRNSAKVVLTIDVSASKMSSSIRPSRELVFAAVAFFASVAIQAIFLFIQASEENNKPILIDSTLVIFAVCVGGMYYSWALLSKPKKNVFWTFIFFAIGILIGFVIHVIYPNFLK